MKVFVFICIGVEYLGTFCSVLFGFRKCNKINYIAHPLRIPGISVTSTLLQVPSQCYKYPAPSYFHSLLRIYIPSRSLRSASERRLVVPSQRGSKSLSRTFSFTIPGWWNNLPTPIRNAGSLSIFKQQLKTHLFRHYLTSS